VHAPDERLPRYTIVWSDGDVHMEVSYLTDEQQQQRLVAQLTKARISAMEILLEIRMVNISMQAAKIIKSGNELMAKDNMTMVPRFLKMFNDQSVSDLKISGSKKEY
jgi:predicted RNA-binding protein with PIN domain